MANEKKPSIYDDRSAIGSSSELDEYGVWVKSEPRDLSAAAGDPGGAEEPAGDFVPGEDFSLDGELSGGFGTDGDTLPGLDTIDGGTQDAGLPDETPLNFDDFDAEGLDGTFPASGPAESGDGQEDYTEVSLSDFLEYPEDAGETEDSPEDDTPLPVPGAGDTVSGAPVSTDLSTQLLMKIADELSSIRTELSSLKQEFSVIRNGAASPAEEPQGRGFFDEEDDEKIALTGDELNNIINTAEFTEEVGLDANESSPGNGPSDGPSGENNSQGAEDLSSGPFQELNEEFSLDTGEEEAPGENGDPAGTGAAEEEPLGGEFPPDSPEDESGLSLDEPLLDEPALADLNEADFALPGDDTLRQLQETGVRPMTAAPENTGYLDEEPLETPAGEEIVLDDLDEVSLDMPGGESGDPALSGDVREDISETPAPADSPPENAPIELDLEDADDTGFLTLDENPEEAEVPEAEGAEEETVEISMDDFLGAPDDGAETGEELIPEGFVVEAGEAPVLPDEDTGLPETGEDNPEAPAAAEPPGGTEDGDLAQMPPSLTQELRTVLSYMDHLLESLPEAKIEEFAKSEYFDTYKKLFRELGIG